MSGFFARTTLATLAACAVVAASANARADVAPPQAMDAATPVVTADDASTTTADASTHTTPVTTTSTTGVCAAYNSVQCSGKSVGEDCQLEDGESGNCGTVTCNGEATLTCIAGKGSAEGGCTVGPADIGSSFAVLALLAPFAALRRTGRKKRRATK